MQQLDIEYISGRNQEITPPAANDALSYSEQEMVIAIPLDENMAAGAGIGGAIGVVFGLLGTSIMVMINSHIVEVVSGFVSSPLMFALSGAGIGAILGGSTGVTLYYLSSLANRAAEKQLQRDQAAKNLAQQAEALEQARQLQWSLEHGHFHLI